MEQQHYHAATYDIAIFGASGFTGKYVVREALKFLNVPSSPLNSLALVGRSPSKVAKALQWASHPNPPPQIPILTADTTDPSSLRRVASQTKIILNCVGPFHLYGEPVVAACVDAGCDYLDITGEMEFVERMEASYHEKAAKKGSLIISACGYDSVPAVLGMMFNSRQWVSPAAPNRVEAYLSMESDKRLVLNLGSYETSVLAMANKDKLQELRRCRPQTPQPMESIVEHQKEIGFWSVVFPSLDKIAVERMVSCLTENPEGIPGVNETAQQFKKREAFWSTVKPLHFGMNMASKSVLGVVRFITLALLLWIFGRFSTGKWLLMKFPGVFSFGLFRKNGPTEEEVASASFKLWFVGRGYSDAALASKEGKKPDMEIITRVTGPEVGYSATPIILIQCALVLLSQRHELPKGGVFLPGIIFGPTDLQQRLQQNGISFDFISKKMLSNKI
ncbi:PREDICTED: probable mitochondrial saccharopine dehydrogenase-like oxidoreductase At5g39410 isoform X2 [Ipomoea nil]|uniref:probable mitochondrial saccharopine dehydrogenase-like oxidoreductase At5g39410 isoform X2 n=1 Tax=Ipomoea nil TaxID=35883 RepID=UPI000900F216|nr:PREDICTED: probable mitochondrial saccharopine dehydrogenase-like oxidoreductase At5g39410 isoform X2 [Ipomoea nil]